MATIVLAQALIDGKGGDPLRNAALVIENGRIVRLGPQSSIHHGPDDLVVDAGDGALLPGLIDLHSHLLYYNGSEYVASSSRPGQRSPAEIVALVAGALDAARLWLSHGVTTVRDLAAEMNLDLGLRDAIYSGKAVGPRIFGAGRALAITGGVRISTENLAISVDGPDEVRRATREQLRAGVNVIKLFASAGIGGGEGQSIGESGWAQFTTEEMRVAVFEAHKAGRTITAHAISARSVKNALEAGVDSVEHANYLDEEGLAMMKARDVVLVPTLAIGETLAESGKRFGYEAHIQERSLRAVECSKETIRIAREGGVRIGTGTDPVTRDTMPREWESMARAGMTPTEIIVAATRTGAELLRIQDRLGTLEIGKIADVVALGSNPLDNVSAIRDVRWVLKDGQIVRSPEHSPTDKLQPVAA